MKHERDYNAFLVSNALNMCEDLQKIKHKNIYFKKSNDTNYKNIDTIERDKMDADYINQCITYKKLLSKFWDGTLQDQDQELFNHLSNTVGLTCDIDNIIIPISPSSVLCSILSGIVLVTKKVKRVAAKISIPKIYPMMWGFLTIFWSIFAFFSAIYPIPIVRSSFLLLIFSSAMLLQNFKDLSPPYS